MTGGLAIDLSKFNEVRIDKSRPAVTVGGGAKTRDVLRPVYEAGFQIRGFTIYRILNCVGLEALSY